MKEGYVYIWMCWVLPVLYENGTCMGILNEVVAKAKKDSA